VHASFDSGLNTNAYYLPFGAAIAGHGFLVLFPRTNPGFYHTETATLRFIIAGVVIDQVSVPNLGPDQSYARTSDGAPGWHITSTPTIDASNSSTQPTPTPTPPSHSSHEDNKGITGGGNGGGNNKGLIDGAQPQWVNLQFPTATSTSPVVLPSTTSLSPTSPGNDGLDTSRRIVLTLLVIALALMLLWCWRLFRRA
jgi:hypothetical protein